MNGKFAAFLTGAVVGGVLGVLFAPDKGSVTRQKISDTASNISGSIQDIIEEGKDIVSNISEKMQGTAESVSYEANKHYRQS